MAMRNTQSPLDAPSAWLRALESRAVLELGGVVAASPLLRMIGRGDEHPVLILPGFLAGDPSTAPLRYILRGQGYWAHGWHLGQNLGPTRHILDGLVARLDELHGRHGAPVSIIGWSLGGIYARRLARRSPEMVRQVITMGSPFRIAPEGRSAASKMYDQLRPIHATEFDDLLPGAADLPLDVPATAIYTRTDGVVRWWQCLESIGPRRENIEVRGSHSGLGFNPAAIYAISDRLARPIDDWRPFKAPFGFGYHFPTPADHRPHRDTTAA
jgi:pimeloyl-ACP methyl ester carboxylesterase